MSIEKELDEMEQAGVVVTGAKSRTLNTDTLKLDRVTFVITAAGPKVIGHFSDGIDDNSFEHILIKEIILDGDTMTFESIRYLEQMQNYFAGLLTRKTELELGKDIKILDKVSSYKGH